MTTYSVAKTAPTVYLDERGNAVNGFIVFVTLEAYDELHEVRVPNLKEATVKAALDNLVSNRDKLANLGKVK